jgi:heptosyltransferase III
MNEDIKKILVIRRDNIGDLVCTTSFIAAVKDTFPNATIDILVNDYNAPIIENHPLINTVYVYRKSRTAKNNTLHRLWSNIKLIKAIRKKQYDIAFMCGNANSSSCAQHTLLTKAKQRVSHHGKTKWNKRAYTIRVPGDLTNIHHVESLYMLLTPFTDEKITRHPASLTPNANAIALFQKKYQQHPTSSLNLPLIAINISTRQEPQKWPLNNYKDLIQKIIDNKIGTPMLLWSPNSTANTKFPGDDTSANTLISHFKNSIFPYPTPKIHDLVAALSQANTVFTPDGGVMHIAAAFQKPTTTFMLKRIAPRWYPWMTPHTLIPIQKNASEISVDTAYTSLTAMLRTTRP